MSKWVTLGMVAAASLGMIGIAAADVPSSLTSTVSCACTADPTGGASTQLPLFCTISPRGGQYSEDINVTTTVRNVVGAPLAGSTVVATAVAVGSSTFIWDPGPPPVADPIENPQTGLSNLSGVFAAKFDEGGVNHHNPPVVYPNLDFSISAQGPGPGSPVALAACTPQLNVTSYDMNADGVVDLIDLVVFAAEYGTSSIPRIADFNWDGAVNLVDLVLFAANYGASLANQ